MGRAWRAKNKEQEAERTRRYAIQNRDVIRAVNRRRKARKRNAEGTHTGADVKRQYKAQRGCCYYCGENVGDEYHIDHIVPLARGGSNGPENIVVACPHCNLSKGNRLPHEWAGSNRLL